MFEVGDTVVCIDNSNCDLLLNKSYIIKKVIFENTPVGVTRHKLSLYVYLEKEWQIYNYEWFVSLEEDRKQKILKLKYGCNIK